MIMPRLDKIHTTAPGGNLCVITSCLNAQVLHCCMYNISLSIELQLCNRLRLVIDSNLVLDLVNMNVFSVHLNCIS